MTRKHRHPQMMVATRPWRAIAFGLAMITAVAWSQPAAEENLLPNARFDQASPWREAVRTALTENGVEVRCERFPVSWTAGSHGKKLAGASVDYRLDGAAPDGAPRPAAVRLVNGDAENVLSFYAPGMIPVERVATEGYLEARIRARGRGTVDLGVFEYGQEYKTKGTGAYCGSAAWSTVTLSDEWQELRTGPFRYTPDAKVGAVCFRLDIRGDAEIAEAFFGAVPPIDRRAALTFALPFEGTMQAAYARGVTLPYENAYANATVDGVLGKAGRFDRKPGPHPDTGWYQFAIGGTYHDEANVPREEGTIELWFRPHRDMLTTPAWRTYTLWAVNRTKGPTLSIHPGEDGSLTLRYTETVLSFAYPSGERLSDEKTAEAALSTGDAFFDAWHHLAFTYDAGRRQVFLDGQRVIEMPAPQPRLPCMTAADLSIGWAGRWAPFSSCADLDEFRIYDGVRYLDAFTPAPEALPVVPVAPAADATAAAPAAALSPLAVDGPARVEDGRLVLPLAAGAARLNLDVEVGDGLPFILSSRGLKLGRKDPVSEDPPIAALPWSAPELTASEDGSWAVRARLERYGVTVRCTLEPQGDRLRLSVSLKHDGEFWRAPLEVRVAVRARGDRRWSGAFDGTADRAVGAPFLPFHAEGLANIFPLAAAWGNGPGVAMAHDPSTILSYLRQGMPAADTLESAWRTVLDPGQESRIGLDVFTFDPRYGSDDAVARYHRRYPGTFQPDPQVDPRVYEGAAVGLVSTSFYMPYTHKPEKKAVFSVQELCRRANAGWEWYYGTGTSAGNWSIEPFLLEALPDTKAKFGRGAPVADQKLWRLNKFDAMENKGIATGFYILTWMEQRYARYYHDAVIGPLDTDDGVSYLDNWWTSGIRDAITMPSWSRAGDLMRRQVRDILAGNPPVAAFCYDVFERDHRDRADRPDAGGARAFDERGAFTAHLAGMGALCDDIRRQRNGAGRTPGIIGNSHAWLAGFPGLFRVDAIIFEGRPFEFVANEHLLRHDARFLGAKHRCMYQGGGNDLMGNYYPEVEKLDPAAVRLDVVAVRMQCFLRGFLNNTWSSPGMTYGVKEIAEGQQDLARTLRCGYRFATAAAVTTPLRVARYGEPACGVFAVVNPTLTPVASSLRIDCDYLGAVPVLAVDGAESTASTGTGRALSLESLALRGLDYRLVETVAAIEGVAADGGVRIEAGLSRTPDARTLRMTLQGAAGGPALLRLGLAPGEVLQTLTVNGQTVTPERDDATRSLAISGLDLAGTVTVECRLHDPRWLSTAAEVTAFPFIDRARGPARVAYDDEAVVHEARRLAEYFQFWTRNTPGVEPVTMKPQLVKPGDAIPAGPAVRLALHPPAGRETPVGILRDGDGLTLWATDAAALRLLLNDLFAALDKVYPYVGVIGNQNLISTYDECSTQEQRALLHHAGLPGKAFSVQQLLSER